MAIVYLHKRKDNNEIFYVGIGKSEKRAYSKINRNKHWNNIVNKYGYIIEITHKDICWEEACSIEKYLISFWRENSKYNICNLTDGGDGTLNLAQEVLKNRNQTIKNAWNDERKKKYSLMLSGENNPFYGKKHSTHTREKMSLNNNPRKHITDEHKSKISKSNLGKKRSIEVKEKLSKLKKGCIAWNKGKSPSDETKEKIRKSVLLLMTKEHKEKISVATKKALQNKKSKNGIINI
jgi:hypothetical protein